MRGKRRPVRLLLLAALSALAACGHVDQRLLSSNDAGKPDAARVDAGSPDAKPDTPDARSDSSPTCPPNQSLCAGACTDTLVDSTNCGACGVACPAGEVCSAGSCSTTCGSGLSRCGGEGGAPYCANLNSDNANCGTCGTACPSGQVCSGGTCSTTCGAPLTRCGAADGGSDAGAAYCADLQSDTDNCGGCGVRCGPYAHAAAACVQGQCREICDAGYLDCSGTGTAGCNVDSQTDPDNCNGCGNVCGPYANATAQCTSGTCGHTCTGSYLDCDGLTENGCEVDSGVDARNCGACGHSCAAGCSAGLCRAVVTAAAGGEHTCAALSDGSVWCWGSDAFRELGDGTTQDRSNPLLVAGVTDVKQLVAGPKYTCALLPAGTVECWGQSPGTSQYGSLHRPALVSGLSGVVSLAAGGDYACALLGDGTVKCWGENNYGQLGDGTTTIERTPVSPVKKLSGVKAVSAGYWHACAIMADDSIECWGDNTNGELGDGSTAAIVPTPQPVSAVEAFNRVACGGAHTCALAQSGGIFCWGANSSGQVGDGTTTQRLLPTHIAVLGNVGGLASASNHTCTSGDFAQCWGQTVDGIQDKPIPVGVQGATAVVTGWRHACEVLPDGSLECWGSNDSGELGDGTTASRSTPEPVVWP